MENPAIKLNWSYKVAKALKENSFVLFLLFSMITGLATWNFYLQNSKTSNHYVDNKLDAQITSNTREHNEIRSTLRLSIDNVSTNLMLIRDDQKEMRQDIKDILRKK